MFKHKVTFFCDSCGMEYLIDEIPMELPPSWILIQPSLANSKGFFPEGYREMYFHFCTIKCACDFLKGEEFRELVVQVNNQNTHGIDEDEDDV